MDVWAKTKMVLIFMVNLREKMNIMGYSVKGKNTQANLYRNPILNRLYKQQKAFKSYRSVLEPGAKTETNHSYSGIYLKIHNTGNSPLKDYKILFEFEGFIKGLANTNEKHVGSPIIPNLTPSKPTVFLNSTEYTGEIIPKNNILVGDDIFISDTIFIKPAIEDSQIILKWKLISDGFKDQGKLTINSEPQIKKDYETLFIDDPKQVEFEKKQIEDYIEEKDEDEK